MERHLIITVCFFLITGCMNGAKNYSLEPEQGLSIHIFDIKTIRSQKKVIGFIEIKNSTDRIAKVSNRELFLYCDGDSASARIKIPGEWEIDKGLINIAKGKTVRYQVYWLIDSCSNVKNIKFNYVKSLDRDEE